MSEPNNYYDNPSKQLTVNDVDLSLEAIIVEVELIESGISMCVLTANNEDGKNYISNLQIGDVVVVKGLANSNEAYQVENSINWSTVNSCFIGSIQELHPAVSRSGELCRAVAYNYGFPLKQTRINTQFGYIYPIQGLNPVFSYDATINDVWYLRGSRPYINGYSFYHSIYAIIDNITKNTGPSDNTSSVGAFNFFVDERYSGGQFIANNPTDNEYGCLLHIVCGVFLDAAGIATSVTVTPYWTTDPINAVSPTWHSFTTTLTDTKFVISSSAPSGGATLGDLTPFFGGYYVPYWKCYALSGHDIGLGFRGYNPIIDLGYHQPPSGWDLVVDCTADLPYWNPNFRVKFSITNYTGTKAGGVSIAMAYLQVNFLESQGKTLRQIIAGDNGSTGIIPNYVNQTVPFNLNGQKTIIGTGYLPLNTDYVYNDANLVPFLKFPYEDTLTSIQDSIKYVGALNFLAIGGGGYHWRIDTLGNFLLAPVGSNHHVTGVDGSHYVDSVPNTIPWVARPYPTPIVIKQSILIQDLKQESPLANFVMVAGKFQFPLNNDICRGRNFNPVLDLVNYNNYGGVPQAIGFYGSWVMVCTQSGQTLTPPPSQQMVFLPSEFSINEPCFEFHTGSGGVTSIWCYPLLDNQGHLIDFTQLMGYNTVPSVSFYLKHGGYVNNVKIRFYLEETDQNGVGKGFPKFDTYFEYYITNLPDQDKWGFIEINLPNLITYADFGNWSVQSLQSYWSLLGIGNPATIDWSDFNKVKYFSIAFDTAADVFGSTPYIRMAELSLNGVVIRAAYDQTSINKFGCRMLCIKDSFARTDTLTNYENNPLGLECLYELLRHNNAQVVNGVTTYGYITGEITIPFDPTWLDGQQVWLQAEDVIPLGVQVVSGSSNPTISTSCNGIGSYYVNTVSWEVYLCTNVVGSNYTWTDQSKVRYKINQWFRITKVKHTFTANGAFTNLTITNDLTNSLSIDTSNVYSSTMRAVNPDFQSKTYGSLKTSGDYDLGLPIIAVAHNS